MVYIELKILYNYYYCEFVITRDGISKSLGIYLTVQQYIQEIYTIEIISSVAFHVSGSLVVR